MNSILEEMSYACETERQKRGVLSIKTLRPVTERMQTHWWRAEADQLRWFFYQCPEVTYLRCV